MIPRGAVTAKRPSTTQGTTSASAPWWWISTSTRASAGPVRRKNSSNGSPTVATIEPAAILAPPRVWQGSTRTSGTSGTRSASSTSGTPPNPSSPWGGAITLTSTQCMPATPSFAVARTT